MRTPCRARGLPGFFILVFPALFDLIRVILYPVEPDAVSLAFNTEFQTSLA